MNRKDLFVAIISCFIFLKGNSIYSQLQREGTVVFGYFTTQSSPASYVQQRILFKDSCVIYEIKERIGTSYTSKDFEVVKYTWLDLRTFICRDYYNLSDTALPFCSYFLKPDETVCWQFYRGKQRWDVTDSMLVMPDTTIGNQLYKRISTVNKVRNHSVEFISYLNCNAAQNIFHKNKTLDERYPGCKVTRTDVVDSKGAILTTSDFKVQKEKLSIEEEKIFKAWDKNASGLKQEVVSYSEAIKIREEQLRLLIKQKIVARNRLNAVDINKWLNEQKDPLTAYKNKNIDRILQNVEYEKMMIEELFNDGELLVIVPLKKEYTCQHVDSNSRLMYLQLIETPWGSIRRGDVIIFYSKDKNLDQLPENSFQGFFQSTPIPVDGTYALITLGDIKEYEMELANSKNKEFRSWIHCETIKGNEQEWYLSTMIYNGDELQENEKFLGTNHSICPPGTVCDEKY